MTVLWACARWFRCSFHLQFPGGSRTVSIFHLFLGQFSVLLLLAFQLSYRIAGFMKIFHTCVTVLCTCPPFRHTEATLQPSYICVCGQHPVCFLLFTYSLIRSSLPLFRPLLPSHYPFVISPTVSFGIYSESGLVCITCRSPHPLSTKWDHVILLFKFLFYLEFHTWVLCHFLSLPIL